MIAKLKIVAIGVLLLLTIIVVLQNAASVETNILFMNFRMPQAALLLVTFVIGYAIGLLSSGYVFRRLKAWKGDDK
jgi:uncharacterized integral membrane protein